MGVPYEFNWYLVVADNSRIKETDTHTYITIKSEHRIYPINSEIPLIIKEKGCIGIIQVLNFKVSSNKTEIEFKFLREFNTNDTISKHYYGMYLHMKKDSCD